MRIAMGLVAIYGTYLLVKALEMELLTAILGQFIGVGVLAGIILFQQEIRKFLLLIGKTAFYKNSSIFKGFFKNKQPANHFNIQPIMEAAKIMAGTHTGALIVLSKTQELRFYADSGDLLDATLSKRLLLSIFNKNSPLHDGAVIVAGGRIVAARCVLPIYDDVDLPAQFGLRHRAAISLTEETDAVVLVVSEETGQISLAHDGVLEHNLNAAELRTKLNFYLFEAREQSDIFKLEEAFN